MAGILNYNKGIYSTKEFRKSLLGRNLPPPVNETLTQSGLVSKLEDIGKVINIPVNGVTSENIPIHYNEEEKMFPLGTFYRSTQNVNLNRYSPQNDEYTTYELTIPPNLGFPLPKVFGVKERGIYPTSYNPEQFFLIGKGKNVSGQYPFNIIEGYKSLNFSRETSLGLIGGQELEKGINEKITYVRNQANSDTPSVGNITLPLGEDGGVNSYLNKLSGNELFFNDLPISSVGWNEYGNTSNIVDNVEGVEKSLSTELRVNSLLEKTSETQVSFILNSLKRNTYRPLYEDRRFQGTSNEGTNSRYYIGSEKNTNRGSVITKTFSEKDFNDDSGESTENGTTTIDEKYIWGGSQSTSFNTKTLLSKTKELVDNYETEVFINQTKKFFKDKKLDKLISRGSGIGKSENPGNTGDYSRVWTVTDKYNYSNAIRKSGLFSSPDVTDLKGFSVTNGKASLSVLNENGIPKYHPTLQDSETTLKKFMFSIENLAWADNLADLPKNEIGPGDFLSRNKGRIMWFPPYELTFDENTSANWTATEFIGRSEPLYTYNNSKRSGSINFKILVDHPRVINCYRGKDSNLIERFNAGTVSPTEFLDNLECSVSQTSRDEIEKLLQGDKTQKISITEKKLLEKDIEFTVNVPECDWTEVSGMCPKDGGDRYKESELITIVTNDILPFVKELIDNGKKVLIKCDGILSEKYAIDRTPTQNKKTSKKYAKEVYNNILSILSGEGVDVKKISPKITGKGVLGDITRVSIKSENSVEKTVKLKDVNNTDPEYNPQVVKLIDNLIIDEGAYFDFIDNNYPNYFNTISEKIRYFHPGFHSTTPEGFNTRLTFLNQCMKQGPSINNSGDNVQPQNLSFGRPPICIIRIGDFFYTKVAINSMNITYDGPTFDLNPEGIGVQPMIATVSLTIDLIGGQSLSGPINRLQNAVSFNYYANTEMYDPRSDTIVNGEIKEGIKLSEVKRKILGENATDKLVDDLKNEIPINQEVDSEDGDNTDGDGKNVIEIDSKKPSEIVIKTKGVKKPGEIIIGGKANSKNKLTYKINKEAEVSSDNAENPVVWTTLKGIVVPTELSGLTTSIETAQTKVDLLQSQLTVGPSPPLIKDLKTAKQELKTAKQKLNDYKKNKSDKIKVIGFLSKNKKKTKTVKTFTITENGLE
tara:strand:- start:1861 stop:5328 length:3468 start_codon:yes stop_codon:yes gene_type:complete